MVQIRGVFGAISRGSRWRKLRVGKRPRDWILERGKSARVPQGEERFDKAVAVM